MKFFDDDTAPDHFTRDDDTPAPQAAVNDPDDPFAPAVSGGNDRRLPGGAADRRRRKLRRALIWIAVLIVAASGAAGYVRYFLPYADDALATGYVRNVERRGLLFKTYEGELLTHEALTDTARIYQRDFTFSVPDDSIARLIQSYQSTGRQVTLTFERYYATVPWRGASKNVVTGVEAR